MTAIPMTFPMTVNGLMIETEDRISVTNPATGQVFGSAPDASQAELDQAVAAARAALPAWRETWWEDRAETLKDIAHAMTEHLDELAGLLTREQGKPLADARSEISRSIQWIEHVADLTLEDEIINDMPGRSIRIRHVPIGVVAALAPWNFPITLAVWKIAPALLAGNTVVLKPSPFTPLTTLRLGQIIAPLLPPGVINVISGSDRLGPWLTAHPGIDKIAFTGSTQTGKAIMGSAAERLRRVTLELGGNDAAIVLPDVDLEDVVPKLFWAAFRNNAQFCLATKRLYVHESIYEPFIKAFAEFAAQVKLGNGLEEGTQIGPVQNQGQWQRVRQFVERARQRGERVLEIAPERTPEQGFFHPIVLVDSPPDDSEIVSEEVFGPVLPILRFKDVDEVLQRVNASEYGLGGSVWSRDTQRAQEIAQRIESGTVWVNTIHELYPSLPFGGHKASGIGVENGMAGLMEYVQFQTVIGITDTGLKHA